MHYIYCFVLIKNKAWTPRTLFLIYYFIKVHTLSELYKCLILLHNTIVKYKLGN